MILKKPNNKNDFKSWYSKISSRLNINQDPYDPNHHYDYEGFYKKYANVQMSDGQHFTDEFKLPGHPTFSDESKYSNVKQPGGTWEKNG